MKTITKAQLKMIHVLLNELSIMDRKPDLVYSFSNGRTESSRELSLQEAKEIIEFLKNAEENKRLINRIWHIAYELKIIVSGDKNEMSMNAAKLDAFCKQRGSVKKSIREQSINELKKTIKQFEAMLQKHQQKEKDKAYLIQLNSYLTEYIKNEEYEMAAQIKAEIDKITKQLAPKRQRCTKNV